MSKKDFDNKIKEFLSGDDQAFDFIYEETKKSVYYSIYTIIKSPQIIEDLMQDTYLQAIKNLDKYALGTNFNAWISKIARNRAIDEYNARKKVEYVEEIYVEDEDKKGGLVDMAYEILDREGSKHEKEVFTYRIVLDMKYREIAEILNIPKSTVYDIYAMAIKRIEKYLK